VRPLWKDFASSIAPPTCVSGIRSAAYGPAVISARPASGRSSPSSSRIVVDLPAPFGPRTRSPGPATRRN